MWIKRSLMIVPLVLLVFLLQSVFWVPGTQQAADNEGRIDRLIWYMTATPEDMNSWQSTSATDSDISVHLSDGLLRYSEMYEIEPWMSRYVNVSHEMVMLLPGSADSTQIETAARELGGAKFNSVKVEASEPPASISELLKDPALGDLVEYLRTARRVSVRLSDAPVDDKVTTAVVPDFPEQLAERLGVDADSPLDAAKIVSGMNDADKARIAATLKAKPEQLAPALGAALGNAGVLTVQHKPTVEFEIHDGVYWTDGPFFSPLDSTFNVSVNGDEAGVFAAASEDEAIKDVRERLGLNESAQIKAWKFKETFGDTKNGPWWGKGPRFTARDVDLTIRLLKDPDFASPRKSSWEAVREVRTHPDNPLRVDVVYDELYSPAIYQLTGGYLPYHVWNDTAWTIEAMRKGLGPRDVNVDPKNYRPARFLRAKARDFSRKPSSYGAMVLYPLNGPEVPLWQNGKLVRLLRNDFYWNRKPDYTYIDYYIFNPQMGAETAEMVFNTGGIDLYGASPHQVRRYEQMDERYYVIKRRTTSYTYIGFNTERAPVNDLLVRKALAMAINVDDVIEYIVYGQGERIAGPGYPVLGWYDHDYRIDHKWRTGPNKDQTEKLKFLPYDLDEARALLVEAGYDFSSGVPVKDGKALEINITMHTGNQQRRDIALLAQQQWQKLGIKVVIEEHEWNVYLSQYVRARNFTVCVLGWTGGLDFDKRQLWHSSYFPPTGLNFASFKNAEADKIMDDILKEYDYDKQVKMSHRMFKLIADELPYIFLYSPWTTTTVDRRVVWMKEAAPGKYEPRPLDHTTIKDARAAFSYWMYEFKRVPETPQWTPEDFKN